MPSGSEVSRGHWAAWVAGMFGAALLCKALERWPEWSLGTMALWILVGVSALGSAAVILRSASRVRAIAIVVAAVGVGFAAAALLAGGRSIEEARVAQDRLMSILHWLILAPMIVGLALAIAWLVVLGDPRRRTALGRVQVAIRRTPAWMVLTFTASLMLGSLGVWWSGLDPIVAFEQEGPHSALVAGRLPFSDANGWFGGTIRLAEGGGVDWAGRRPAHALARAGALVVGDRRHDASLVVQAILISLGISAAAVVAMRCLAPAVGLIAWSTLLAFGQSFVGSYLSEGMGLAVACAGCATFVAGWSRGSLRMRALAASLIGLAMLIRPGPMLILAALPLAELVATRRRLRSAAAVAAVVVATMILGRGMFALVSAPGAEPNSNAAHTILGISRGMHWSQAYREFLQENAGNPPRTLKEESRRLYDAAWRNLRQDPRPAVRFVAQQSVAGLAKISGGLFGQGMEARPASLACFWIGAVFLIALVVQRRAAALPLAIVLASALLPLGIIWGDGGWRGVTVAMPFLALLVGMVGIAGRGAPPRQRDEAWLVAAASIAPWGLIAVGVSAFLVGRSMHGSDPGMQYDDGHGARVLLTEDQERIGPWGTIEVPRRAVGELLRRLMPVEYKLPEGLEAIETPAWLVVGSPGPGPGPWVAVSCRDGSPVPSEVSVLRPTESYLIAIGEAQPDPPSPDDDEP